MISDREITLTYPQPIAYAFHQIRRSMTPVEKFDAIIRCGEVIARYLCSLALASFAARSEQNVDIPQAIQQFRGSLSFGKYLSVVQALAKERFEHPLQTYLKQIMYDKKNNVSETHQILIAILERRNEWGHSLTALNNDAAQQKLEQGQHEAKLRTVLAGIQPIGVLPLIYVDQVNFDKGEIHLRRLLLMELNDEPAPDSIIIHYHERMPNPSYLYLGTPEGLLRLYPMLLWTLQKENAMRSIYILDKLDKGNKPICYQSIRLNEPDKSPEYSEIEPLLNGEIHPIYPIQPKSYPSFVLEWQHKRKAILSGESTQTLHWEKLNQNTLKWYAGLLKKPNEITPTSQDPLNIIREKLLDGNGELSESDWKQFQLLFGDWETLKPLLKREYLLDLRRRTDQSERWTERMMVQDNVFEAFRKAGMFIQSALPFLENTPSDSFSQTSGSLNYVWVREALVNLSVHQDYTDNQMAAQIELEPHVTRFSNPGRSLVSDEQLIDGGLSVARNPLIGKAFRLIGFAELAGSGLRKIHNVWREHHRRPPQVISHENYFSLTLDDRALDLLPAAIWAEKLSRRLPEEQTQILSLLKAMPKGLNLAELCSATGFDRMSTENACVDLQHLKYILNQNGHYRLSPDLTLE